MNIKTCAVYFSKELNSYRFVIFRLRFPDRVRADDFDKAERFIYNAVAKRSPDVGR